MKYTEEETRAISRSKEKLEEKFYIVDILHEDLEILLNLLEKQQKELEEQLELAKKALKYQCKIADERNQLLVEKRKLMSEYHKRVQENCDLERELEDVKEECHELYISNEHKKENWIPKEILNSYISKETIRKKIEEYAGLKEMDLRAYEEQVKPLKELLGE